VDNGEHVDKEGGAEGDNTLGGDQIGRYLRVEDGVVTDAAFPGVGLRRLQNGGVPDEGERDRPAGRLGASDRVSSRAAAG
jgi:hypothetical protein